VFRSDRPIEGGDDVDAQAAANSDASASLLLFPIEEQVMGRTWRSFDEIPVQPRRLRAASPPAGVARRNRRELESFDVNDSIDSDRCLECEFACPPLTCRLWGSPDA
jgi:hypothetical protein